MVHPRVFAPSTSACATPISNPQTGTGLLLVRSNDGSQTVHVPTEGVSTQSLIQSAMTPDNRVIQLRLNGSNWQRWERLHMDGGHRWREVSPHEPDTTGSTGSMRALQMQHPKTKPTGTHAMGRGTQLLALLGLRKR